MSRSGPVHRQRALAAPALAADPPPPFDWDSGNAAFTIVVSEIDPIILSYVAVSDATVILRLNALIATAMFDATAPYHPTAVGLFSNLGRRPASESESESATNRNKNIALTYAAYRVFLAAFPLTAVPGLRAIMAKYGLDPDDNTLNLTTPIGIGNSAAKAILAARNGDGMNMLGDVGWGAYNREMYRDYTNYQPPPENRNVDIGPGRTPWGRPGRASLCFGPHGTDRSSGYHGRATILYAGTSMSTGITITTINR